MTAQCFPSEGKEKKNKIKKTLQEIKQSEPWKSDG